MSIDSNAYSVVAAFYDRLNDEIDYEQWAAFLCAVFDRYASAAPSLVLDLACGTGSMTIALGRRGYDIIGIDLSADMLSEARRRASEAGQSPLLLHQDMCAIDLYGTVDAAVCCLDGMNYLTDKGDLYRCLRGVHNYLNPEGLFIFDVNTPYKFEHIYGNQSYILESEGIFCAWQNDYNKKTKLCRFYLTLFEEQRNGQYRRLEEMQTERCYSMRALKKAVSDNGFSLLSVVSDHQFTDAGEADERWHFICRKAK